jgi:hypothetical protein
VKTTHNRKISITGKADFISAPGNDTKKVNKQHNTIAKAHINITSNKFLT